MAGTAKKILCVILAAVLCMAVFSPAGAQTPQEGRGEIVFVDVGWDSIRLNNAIAGLIAEKVFGYTWTEVPGSTPIAHEALMNGEIDVNMEEWTDNIPSYQADLEAGKFTELGVNFNDNYQDVYKRQGIEQMRRRTAWPAGRDEGGIHAGCCTSRPVQWPNQVHKRSRTKKADSKQ